jgi:hypothetical protein
LPEKVRMWLDQGQYHPLSQVVLTVSKCDFYY